MYGIAPKLPIGVEPEGNLQNTKTLAENTQQNLKNIILTAPGERVMDPEFGVGLRNYLFENHTRALESQLEQSIRHQVAKYMPFVNIKELLLDSAESNTLQIHLRYSIAGVSSDELLFVSLQTNSR
tara:strand:+ start:73 stop:450 length:378 start_codon:yes stop_codon:yes gene_type:complete